MMEEDYEFNPCDTRAPCVADELPSTSFDVSTNKPKLGVLIRVRNLDELQDNPTTNENGVTTEAAAALTPSNDEPRNTNSMEECLVKTYRKCSSCQKKAYVKYSCRINNETFYFCTESCSMLYFEMLSRDHSYPVSYLLHYKCGRCNKNTKTMDLKFFWDFSYYCSCVCLRSQLKNKKCYKCLNIITDRDLGPYALHYNGFVRLFCSQSCKDYIDNISSSCQYCLCKMTKPGEFCDQVCANKHANLVEKLATPKCIVCKKRKEAAYQLQKNDQLQYFCSADCVERLTSKQVSSISCFNCKNVYVNCCQWFHFSFFGSEYNFCCTSCRNRFVGSFFAQAACTFCRRNTREFDALQIIDGDEFIKMCSLGCLEAYNGLIYCYKCKKKLVPEFKTDHTDIPGASLCVECSRKLKKKEEKSSAKAKATDKGEVVFSSTLDPAAPFMISSVSSMEETPNEIEAVSVVRSQPIILLRNEPPARSNVATMCTVRQKHQSVSIAPETCDKECQTDRELLQKFPVPIPVPMHMPVPLPMYNLPVPTPVPFPIPIPVPIFIPTTRNSYKKIMEDIKRIRGDETADDPCQAELLTMASMISEKVGEAEADKTEASLESPRGVKRKERSPTPTNDENLPPYDDETFVESCRSISFKKSPPNKMNSCIGLSAWYIWVKNLQNPNSNQKQTFNKDMLKYSSSELNLALSTFLKQIKNPRGQDYNPDTSYYICLSIQKYLLSKERDDNIFCDEDYKQFQTTLNEIAEKFNSIFDSDRIVVTAISEDHLWDCKQLGAHSPQVLLRTLIYFNTKYFRFHTVQQHLSLTFGRMVLHRKKRSNDFILSFFSGKYQGPFEQPCNTEEPEKCPVSIYKFYLSKCPEVIRGSYLVLYLEPEKSSCPESPIWFTTNGLSEEKIGQAVNLAKMVKEVNM